jgi:hypothetical protein
MFSASQDKLRELEKEISAGQDTLKRHKWLPGRTVKGHKLLACQKELKSKIVDIKAVQSEFKEIITDTLDRQAEGCHC